MSKTTPCPVKDMKDFWQKEATGLLKSLLARESVSYKGLSALLAHNGLSENPEQLKNKINRGTFSFGFFLKCCAALGHTEVSFRLRNPVPREENFSGRPRQSK